MGDTKTLLEDRCRSLYELLDKGDYDTASSMFTEDATSMPHGGATVVGRSAIKDTLEKLYPLYKTLVLERIRDCTTTGDDSVYTIDYTKSVDENGKVKGIFHGSRFWKKIDGEWFIKKEMFNHRRQPTPEEDVKKLIEIKIRAMVEAFNNKDCEAASEFYDRDAIVIPHEGNIAEGRDAILGLFRLVMPYLKKFAFVECSEFEMLSEDTASSVSYTRSLGDSAESQTVIRDCLVWIRRGADWFILRDIFNDKDTKSQ